MVKKEIQTLAEYNETKSKLCLLITTTEKNITILQVKSTTLREWMDIFSFRLLKFKNFENLYKKHYNFTCFKLKIKQWLTDKLFKMELLG